MASSDQDPEIEKRKAEAFDRLLAESLSSSGARGADCPDAETLAAFYERALDPAETANWRVHFAGCSRCQQALAAMAASDPNPLAADEIERLGELVAAAPAPPDAAPRPRTMKWPWFLDPRSLAPVAAAAVLILALIATLNSPPDDFMVDERTGAALNYQFALPSQTSQPAVAENKSALLQPPIVPAPAPPGATNESRALQTQAHNAALAPAAQPAPTAPQQVQPQQAQTAASESAEQTVIVAPAQTPTPVPAPSDSAAAANATAGAESRSAAPGGAEQSSAAPVTGGAIAGMMANEGSQSAQYMRAKALGFRPGDLVVAATNPQIVWRFGPRGHIERSTDGGNTWTPESSPVQADLLAGSAPSETVCWIVGRSGTILRSTDGLTWQIVPSPKPAEQNFKPPDWISVDAHDAQSAVIRTQDGRGFSTSDAGKTWRPR